MTGRWTPLNRGGRRPIDLPAAETSHRIITLPSSKLHSAQCSTQIQSNCLHPSCTLQCTTHCVVHSTHCTVYYTNTSKNTITDLQPRLHCTAGSHHCSLYKWTRLLHYWPRWIITAVGPFQCRPLHVFFQFSWPIDYKRAKLLPWRIDCVDNIDITQKIAKCTNDHSRVQAVFRTQWWR